MERLRAGRIAEHVRRFALRAPDRIAVGFSLAFPLPFRANVNAYPSAFSRKRRGRKRFRDDAQ